MDIYLDNSATTKPYAEVSSMVCHVTNNIYGNPSSMHKKGIDAEKLIKTARAQVAASLKCGPNEIFFTSGGTEANNLAVLGGSKANRGKRIITSAIEHPATLSAVNHLQSKGYHVDILEVDKQGLINMEQLKRLVANDTVLVSIMHVNNEIGVVQDVERIGRIIKSINPSTLFHVDAVQSYGKIEVIPDKIMADLVTVSSHKIHGPKGIGGLYIKVGTKIAPILFGGGQQQDLRPGTENVAGIAGFGLASAMISRNIPAKSAYLTKCRERLHKGIINTVPDVHVNTPTDVCAPHILNVSFAGVKSEVLLHSLEEKDIFVSSGSACSSHKKGAKSYVLKAIGLPDMWIDGSIRFSLSEFTKEADIDYTVQTLSEIVPKLRMVRR